MPQKINMVISNGNIQQQFIQKQFNTASLSSVSMSTAKAPSGLKAPMLARVHNVRPGCGSCGRH
jgi:hypothetical protein